VPAPQHRRHFATRLSPQERADVEQAAKLANLSPAAWARKALVERAQGEIARHEQVNPFLSAQPGIDPNGQPVLLARSA
jgi:hypothetical protein